MNLSRFLEVTRSGGTTADALESHIVWKGGDGEKSTQTSTPMQTPQYKNLLKNADSWLNSGGLDQAYGVKDPVADLTDAQTSAISGMANSSSNLQGLYNGAGLESLSDYLGSYDPQKTGLTSAIQAANEGLDWNYQTSVAPQIRQGATDSGQFGSSRHGIAEGLAIDRLNQTKANNAANMAYQDQQAFNQNRLSTLRDLTNITSGLNAGYTSQYNAGALEQKQNQAEISGELEKWAYENNVDLNNLLAYKQLISGDMGGTTTTKTSGGSSGMAGFGQLAGTALGAMFGGPMGAYVGSQIGGSAGQSLGGLF